MFSYFRKGRSESKTFIEDKVKWFHFMKGFNDLFYEYTLYNILKRYPDYHIEQGEYTESIKYFNKLCECCSTHFNKRLDKTDHTWIERVYAVIGTNSFAKSTNEYKKSKLFEILIILYITEGHKAINSFPDFIEKWFRDGILILITDQGDEVKNEMKNKFFDKKSEFSYTYKTKFHRFIFEIERETGKIGLSIFPSYYDYFIFNKVSDDITKGLENNSMLDSLKYSYESQPIAKCQWVSRKKEGVEFGMKALSREDFNKVFGKTNPIFASARLFTDMYEKERNTKQLIRKITGISNKDYKDFLERVNKNVFNPDNKTAARLSKLSRMSDFPINERYVASSMRWLLKKSSFKSFRSMYAAITLWDIIDAIYELKEEK